MGMHASIKLKSKNKLDFEKLDYFTVGGYTVGEGEDSISFDWNAMIGNSEKEEGYMYVECDLEDFTIGDNDEEYDDLSWFDPKTLTSRQLTEVYYDAEYNGKFIEFELVYFILKYYDRGKDEWIYLDFSKDNIDEFNTNYRGF